MELTGHNSFMGCRFCNLRGANSCNAGSNHVYYPLKSDRTQYNFANLPLRTHRDYLQRACRSEEETTNAGRKRCAGETGK